MTVPLVVQRSYRNSKSVNSTILQEHLKSFDGLFLTVPKSIHRTTGEKFAESLNFGRIELPIEIRRTKEVSSFKSEFKGLLFNKAYSQLL